MAEKTKGKTKKPRDPFSFRFGANATKKPRKATGGRGGRGGNAFGGS